MPPVARAQPGGSPVAPGSNPSPFLGGVPAGTATPEPLSLSMAAAIDRALEHNLGVILAEQRSSSAAGVRTEQLADLLPHLTASVSETRRKTNLEAFGFPLRPDFPKVVGPFNVFDA